MSHVAWSATQSTTPTAVRQRQRYPQSRETRPLLDRSKTILVLGAAAPRPMTGSPQFLPQSLHQPPLELLCGYAVARCRRSPKCTRKKDSDISFARTLGKLLEEPYRFMPREHAVWRDRKRPFSGRRPVGLDPFSYPGFDVAAGRPHVDVVWILLVQRSGSRRIFIATRKQNLMGTAGLRYVATWKSDSRFARGAKDEGWGEALDTAIDGGMVQDLASHEVYWLASSPTPSTSSATAISCKYRGMMVCKKS